MAKKKELPKGLLEFGASLADPEYSGELMRRLLDLSENGLAADVARHAEALRAVEQAERHLTACRRRARELAEATYRYVLQNWSVEEIQKVTGYDDE